MALYPDKIALLLREISHSGVEAESALGRSATFACGCFAEFSISDASEGNESGDIRFASNGCGYMLAAAEHIASALEHQTPKELHGLGDELYADVERRLGVFPPERRHCLECCVDAIRAAFAELRRHRIEEFRGEEALVCTCFGVTEARIDEVIAAHDPNTVDDVSDICNAGSGCGSCRMLIEEMLAAGKAN